jgi:negative regulator of flagellin synthesis FlgM
MKINDLKDTASQMIQSYQRGDNLNQAVDKQAAPAAAATEKVDISSRAKEIQLAKAVIDSLPEIRDAKVQELKTQIEQGSYKIDSDKLAKKMVRESLIDIFG